MPKKLIEPDNIEVENIETNPEMTQKFDNKHYKEMYVYDPKNKSIKTVVQKKQTRKHFNEEQMKERMEKMRALRFKNKQKPEAKEEAKQEPQEPKPQEPKPTQNMQFDILNIRDLIRSELLNHIPKPKPQEEHETPKQIEIEKVKPKRTRKPAQKIEQQVLVENKNIEVPKSFIPQNYISPSFSIFGY